MPMRRENVAAALRYLGNQRQKVRERLERATSLDPQEQDLTDIAVETGASFIPGVGPALAARDFERARRADDEVGMGLAAASAVPGGRLAGLLKRYDPTRLELDVYHGTPHRFEPTEANPLGEFDASKIGTGEGAQAYGHGVYYAENPTVAQGYKTANELTNTLIDGKQVEFADPRYQAAVRISTQGYKNALDTAMKEAESNFLTAEGKAKRLELAEQIKALKGRKVGSETTGSLYKADLPDEMIDRMLDWDKPLSEQPAAVREAIETRLRHSNSSRKFLEKNPTGADLYGVFQNRGDYINPIEASEAFREAGIPGIKYLDADSRGQSGSGTRNFVVFPGEEKKVRILERK